MTLRTYNSSVLSVQRFRVRSTNCFTHNLPGFGIVDGYGW